MTDKPGKYTPDQPVVPGADVISYLYVITRILTGQQYVGITADPEKRWYEHGWLSKTKRTRQLIHRAIRKYGIDAFRFEVVGCCRRWSDACLAEAQLICQLGSHVTSGGYNLTLGGEGPNGRVCSEETRRRISAGNTGKVGRVNTEEEKAAARARLLKRWAENPQQFAEAASMGGKAQVGRKNSPETKARMSASAYKVWAARRARATNPEVAHG